MQGGSQACMSFVHNEYDKFTMIESLKSKVKNFPLRFAGQCVVSYYVTLFASQSNLMRKALLARVMALVEFVNLCRTTFVQCCPPEFEKIIWFKVFAFMSDTHRLKAILEGKNRGCIKGFGFKPQAG